MQIKKIKKKLQKGKKYTLIRKKIEIRVNWEKEKYEKMEIKIN